MNCGESCYEGGEFSSISPAMRCIAGVLPLDAKCRSLTFLSFRVVGESCWSVGETVGLELWVSYCTPDDCSGKNAQTRWSDGRTEGVATATGVLTWPAPSSSRGAPSGPLRRRERRGRRSGRESHHSLAVSYQHMNKTHD